MFPGMVVEAGSLVLGRRRKLYNCCFGPLVLAVSNATQNCNVKFTMLVRGLKICEREANE